MPGGGLVPDPLYSLYGGQFDPRRAPTRADAARLRSGLLSGVQAADSGSNADGGASSYSPQPVSGGLELGAFFPSPVLGPRSPAGKTLSLLNRIGSKILFLILLSCSARNSQFQLVFKVLGGVICLSGALGFPV